MADVQQWLEQRVAAAIQSAVAGQAGASGIETVDPAVRPSGNAKFGDYQVNAAMALARLLGAKPRDVAERIVERLGPLLAEDDAAERLEVAGPGFINIHLKAPFLGRYANAMAADDRLGIVPADDAKTVVVDYSCPNVAKEMGVWHIRSTCIGDALVRVLEACGHTVIRQNHIGDWGTQFGMLLEHLIDESWQDGQAHHIADLNAMYQRAKRRFDEDENFARRARARVVALQSGEELSTKIWHALIAESVNHFRPVYQRLGVRLTDDDIRGESFYNPMLPQVVAELQSKSLARESDGAICAFPPGFTNRDGEPLAMIVRKRDGGYLYATTDLAAVRYRIETLKADRIVYVTDARQSQHYAMLFTVARQAGWLPDHVVAEHVPFGTILGKDHRPFKTRAGEFVKLVDVLDEAEQRAAAIIEQKNPELPGDEKQLVAHAIGIGAVKYADLANDRVRDYVFDWDRMLAFDGNTAPYLINAYVRIRSIFRKGEVDLCSLDGATILVTEPAERALVLKLLQLPAIVAGVAASLEPHRLCNYLYELAALYHQFYEQCPVLKAPDTATRDSRLRLSDLAARVLSRGLDLLGIAVVERM